MRRITFKKGPTRDGQMRLAEHYFIKVDGKEVGRIQRHANHDTWFWYGGGTNTANRRATLEECKEQAFAHFALKLKEPSHDQIQQNRPGT